MTSYQGGKKRLGKKIYKQISEIEKIFTDEKLDYFEPFVGMGGVLRHFGKEKDRKCFACDVNKDLILMWKAVQQGWLPPTECTKEKYNELKNSKEHSAERAFIGCSLSWGGNYFEGSCRLDYTTSINYLTLGLTGISKIKNDIINVHFYENKAYNKFYPKNMLIYCDPPYKNNQLRTKLFKNFDHDKFWETMREWSKENLVVISESVAPEDFTKIWSIESRNTTNKKNGTKHYLDCLFIHSSLLN